MPQPVSRRPRAPRRAPARARSGVPGTGSRQVDAGASRRRACRPCGMASRALTTRFMSTCSIWPAVGLDRPQVGVEVAWPARCPRRSGGAASSPRSSPRSFRSSTVGRSTCLRLKASSCRVRAAAPLGRPRWIIVQQLAGRGRPAGSSSEVAAAEDDGQQVVEVVGHAAGQPADGLHLLGRRTGPSRAVPPGQPGWTAGRRCAGRPAGGRAAPRCRTAW